MCSCVVLSSLLSVLLSMPAALQTVQSPAPRLELTVTDNPAVAESWAVLSLGLVRDGSRHDVSVRVRNLTTQELTVDAFTFGANALATWDTADPVTGLGTRKAIAAGATETLRIAVIADLSSAAGYPVVTLNSEWTQLQRLDLVYFGMDVTTATKTATTDWLRSGLGEGWSAIRFCTPAAPPGFKVVEENHDLNAAPGDKNDPRGCHSWGECNPVPAGAGEGICYGVRVQGHHEGPSRAKDATVGYRFWIAYRFEFDVSSPESRVRLFPGSAVQSKSQATQQ